jgi:hypothetical protein
MVPSCEKVYTDEAMSVVTSRKTKFVPSTMKTPGFSPLELPAVPTPERNAMSTRVFVFKE